MSSLGMNKKGEVHSASEFKEIYEETGDSYSPYCCPFCETAYEDRCIVTECVKAPHFKLPNGTYHRHECTGEASDELSHVEIASSKAPRRMIVGGIELPEALVIRRNATRVRKLGDEGGGPPPDSTEVRRRHKLVAADKTISSLYTTSLLRPIVHGYKKLRKAAFDQATADKQKPGTPKYNEIFRNMLSGYRLKLFESRLNYGNAFQGGKLAPSREPRIYFGSGTVQANGDFLVIKDKDKWPKQPKNTIDAVPFEIKIKRILPPDASTSHQHALNELNQIATSNQTIDWWAYGLPQLQGEKFELPLESLDHFYWIGQYQRTVKTPSPAK